MGRPRAGGEMGLKEQQQIQGANQDFLTLDLPTHTYADAIHFTSCANFYFCGISFQTSSAAHNVH